MSEHRNRIRVCLGLILAGVAQGDQLFCIGADIPCHQANQSADSELADERLGNMSALHMRDLMRQNPHVKASM